MEKTLINQEHLNIEIKAIPHKEHRYETVGDYWEDGDVEKYRVSKMSDRRKEVLVIVHELIENEMRKIDGIREEDITAFDKEFEAERLIRLSKHKEGSEEYEEILSEEAGDRPDAPYYKHHQVATGFERLLAALLGVDWEAYGDEVMHL